MMVRTMPLKQWEVARELRRRIKIRRDQAGVRAPHLQRVIRTHPATEGCGAPSPAFDGGQCP
jgi:small-conductance mechanosensitive channel